MIKSYLFRKGFPHANKHGALPGTLQWRHNEHNGVSNHRRLDCLLNRLFRRRSKKTSKFRVTGLCEGNSPVACESSAQMASHAENVSIWWRHHQFRWLYTIQKEPCEHRVANLSSHPLNKFNNPNSAVSLLNYGHLNIFLTYSVLKYIEED